MKIIKSLLLASTMMFASAPFNDGGCTANAAPSLSKAEVKKTVHGVAVSPYVRKVRIVMFEKGLEHELKEVLPAKILKALNQDVPAELTAISPLGKIPAYTEGSFTIADSGIIVDYLDRTNSANPLYPEDAKERARVEWFHKYADEVVAGVVLHKVFIERVLKPQILKADTDTLVVDQALREELPKVLQYLENELGNKQWIVGDKFTMADIALGSQFVNLTLSGEKIDAQIYPKFAAYIDRVHARDSFKKATAAQ